ncbi:MAG: hypothetical protein QOC63_1487 [Mycobacterium sp.]|nr:hypothetical protein [Mycobacterium sp.]
MHTDTVDRQFSALQQQAQQTASLIAALAAKLSTAATAGDPNAREWGLDLKEIALAIRDSRAHRQSRDRGVIPVTGGDNAARRVLATAD